MKTDVDLTVGNKTDHGKPRLDLLAPEFIFGVGEVLKFGAAKYDDRNWEKGMKWGRVIASLLRHTFKFMIGEKLDQESGLPHTWHISCNAMFLCAYEARGVGTDDRLKI